MKTTRWDSWALSIAVLSLPVLVALGCGGGGGGGNPNPNCTADTSDITTGTIVRGTIKNEDLANVPNIVIQFFRADGTQIRTALTSCSGQFAVSMPEVPAKFHVQSGSIPNTYYKSYRYGGKVYDPTSSSCKVTLTGLIANGNNVLGTIALTKKTSPPPPPPTGCL